MVSRQLGGIQWIPAHSQTTPHPTLTPIMTIPSLEHVTVKTTAPHVLQRPHGHPHVPRPKFELEPHHRLP